MKPTETLGGESPHRNEFSLFIIPRLSAVQCGKHDTSFMSGNDTMRGSTTCIMCVETNRMTDNILEAPVCDVISCCGREKPCKLGHIVRESSRLWQPPLCLSSTTSKNISSVFSSFLHLSASHFLLSPHQASLRLQQRTICLHPSFLTQLPSSNVECCSEKQLTLPRR